MQPQAPVPCQLVTLGAVVSVVERQAQSLAVWSVHASASWGHSLHSTEYRDPASGATEDTTKAKPGPYSESTPHKVDGHAHTCRP